jgi:D-beta-D-heptose 7-phosphate kinase/D-beta-D-heptose 1-phosphate adenosyltransferase
MKQAVSGATVPVHSPGDLLIFTNGVFDGLHEGHFRLLQRCRKLAAGGKVIVGLNSDHSATCTKRCPKHDQETRKFMLQSLTFVDEVIIFSELDPLRLIKEIRPDIIVKGADYENKEVIGSEFAKVVFVPLVMNGDKKVSSRDL